MKKSIKTIIFAVVFGVSITGANATTRSEQNPVTSDVLLANGNEVRFAEYMNQKASRFINKKIDWKLFNEIVTLYNTSPSKFMSVDESKKSEFVQVSNQICAKLAKKNSSEAKEWCKKVQTTSEVIKYLWTNKVEEKPLNNEDLNSAPTKDITVVLGR